MEKEIKENVMEYMIWFDKNNLKPLWQRVIEGASYYEQKFGKRANVCLVSLEDLPSPPASLPQLGQVNMRILTDRRVMKNHFWLGVEEGNQDAAQGG